MNTNAPEYVQVGSNLLSPAAYNRLCKRLMKHTSFSESEDVPVNLEEEPLTAFVARKNTSLIREEMQELLPRLEYAISKMEKSKRTKGTIEKLTRIKKDMWDFYEDPSRGTLYPICLPRKFQAK